MPFCVVLVIHYFATSVYPAIWAFWGIARFNWSESIIGLTLAIFGLITALAQGLATGPLVKWLGERRTVIFGLFASLVSVASYGFAPNTMIVLMLFIVHAPEGFVDPALTALMSRDAPANAQGELQGGIASARNLAMLGGTVMFAQIFGYFMQPSAPVQSPNIAFYTASALCAVALLYFASRRTTQP